MAMQQITELLLKTTFILPGYKHLNVDANHEGMHITHTEKK